MVKWDVVVWCECYSLSLCHSAIWRLGDVTTSLQWWLADPQEVARVPPSSSRPITCECKCDHLVKIYAWRQYIRWKEIQPWTFFFAINRGDGINGNTGKEWRGKIFRRGVGSDLVFGDAIPVQQQELKADGVKSLHTGGKVEHEGLVEHRVECSLLHVGFFLGQPLTIIQQVDLHIRICKPGRMQSFVIAVPKYWLINGSYIVWM